MPGIVGLITSMPSECAKQELARMVQSVCHESFYHTGTWMNEPLGVYIGWVARKNSFSDGMPLRNDGEEVVLVFSGEEYPEPGTARRLKERGHSLDMDGASYLVHLYEEDPTFFTSLNGMFHGLLTDRTRGLAMLFNDRYGMHRLYYHQSKEAFYFAAEAKAILAVRPELRRLDCRGLGEFVARGCGVKNPPLFEGIHVLPPASAWLFRNATLANRGTYFHTQEWEDQELLEPESYYKQLRQVFSGNLPRYFHAGQDVGLSLTAGLDTRMI